MNEKEEIKTFEANIISLLERYPQDIDFPQLIKTLKKDYSATVLWNTRGIEDLIWKHPVVENQKGDILGYYFFHLYRDSIYKWYILTVGKMRNTSNYKISQGVSE